MLEAVLAMPTQEMGMRTLKHPLRRNRASASVDEGSHSIGIIRLPGDQDLQIIRQADQAPVKHPVRRPRQCHSVADNIRAIGLDRLDMSRRDFRPSAAVDQL
jgi:hypothetical protein